MSTCCLGFKEVFGILPGRQVLGCNLIVLDCNCLSSDLVEAVGCPADVSFK